MTQYDFWTVRCSVMVQFGEVYVSKLLCNLICRTLPHISLFFFFKVFFWHFTDLLDRSAQVHCKKPRYMGRHSTNRAKRRSLTSVFTLGHTRTWNLILTNLLSVNDFTLLCFVFQTCLANLESVFLTRWSSDCWCFLPRIHNCWICRVAFCNL